MKLDEERLKNFQVARTFARDKRINHIGTRTQLGDEYFKKYLFSGCYREFCVPSLSANFSGILPSLELEVFLFFYVKSFKKGLVGVQIRGEKILIRENLFRPFFNN